MTDWDPLERLIGIVGIAHSLPEEQWSQHRQHVFDMRGVEKFETAKLDEGNVAAGELHYRFGGWRDGSASLHRDKRRRQTTEEALTETGERRGRADRASGGRTAARTNCEAGAPRETDCVAGHIGLEL
jgi:hypothetical protein